MLVVCSRQVAKDQGMLGVTLELITADISFESYFVVVVVLGGRGRGVCRLSFEIRVKPI